MDFMINNLAPDVDAVEFVFGESMDNSVVLTVARQEGGEVVMTAIDYHNNVTYKVVLGREGVEDSQLAE